MEQTRSICLLQLLVTLPQNARTRTHTEAHGDMHAEDTVSTASVQSGPDLKSFYLAESSHVLKFSLHAMPSCCDSPIYHYTKKNNHLKLCRRCIYKTSQVLQRKQPLAETTRYSSAPVFHVFATQDHNSDFCIDT